MVARLRAGLNDGEEPFFGTFPLFPGLKIFRHYIFKIGYLR
jgi:hypothetical protein